MDKEKSQKVFIVRVVVTAYKQYDFNELDRQEIEFTGSQDSLRGVDISEAVESMKNIVLANASDKAMLEALFECEQQK